MEIPLMGPWLAFFVIVGACVLIVGLLAWATSRRELKGWMFLGLIAGLVIYAVYSDNVLLPKHLKEEKQRVIASVASIDAGMQNPAFFQKLVAAANGYWGSHWSVQTADGHYTIVIVDHQFSTGYGGLGPAPDLGSVAHHKAVDYITSALEMCRSHISSLAEIRLDLSAKDDRGNSATYQASFRNDRRTIPVAESELRQLADTGLHVSVDTATGKKWVYTTK